MLTIYGAVENREREFMRVGMRQLISCAIMPPIETPTRFSCRSAVQERCSRSSMMSLAISEVEYRRMGLSDLPIPEWY